MTAARIQSSGGQILRPNMCAFSVRLTSEITSLNAASAAVAVDYNSNGIEIFDRGGDYDLANNKFIVPVTGLYQLNFSLRVQSISANNYIIGGIRVVNYSGNGQGTLEADNLYAQSYAINGAPPTDFHHSQNSFLASLTAGVEIEHTIRSESDTNITLNDRGVSFSGFLVG
jgi:hypothetical protein